MFLTTIRASQGDAQDRSPWGNWWFQELGARSSAGVPVTGDSALSLPAVYASVRVLAESFACMPFVMYQPNPQQKGRGAQVTNHWLRRLMAKRPNRFQSPFEWRLMLQGHLALRGNAFCQIMANGRGEITELLPLHPGRMTAVPLDNGSYRFDYASPDGQTIQFQRGEVWHLRGMSGDGIMGYSPIRLAAEAIGEGLSMQSYSARFFKNDAKPGGWIEYPGQFKTAEAKRSWRDSWQEMQAGANRGKVAVLERGMKFHEIGMNNTDAQFIEAKGLKVEDIARIFRVPPHKIGHLQRSTNNNIESQSIEFWTDTMLPYAELWESSIETFLLGQDGTETVEYDTEFDMSRMLRGDTVARTAYYTAGINSGWLTRNEARDAEGYDPKDGLDEPLRPLNMVEESDATDEIAEGDNGADDKAKPQDTEPGVDASRFKALLIGGADRMARRIAAGDWPRDGVLADALALPEQAASAIKDRAESEGWATAEAHIVATHLLGIALKGQA